MLALLFMDADTKLIDQDATGKANLLATGLKKLAGRNPPYF